MFWTRKLAWVIALLLLLMTAIAIACSTKGWNYWPERFSHFQIQYWLVGIFVTLLVLSLRIRYPILLGLFCLALLSAPVLSWYIPASSTTTPLTKVLFSNVWTFNQNYSGVLSLVRSENPDIAVFAEVSQEWKQQLDTLKDVWPYVTRDKKGEIVYSKLKFEGTEIIDDDPRFINSLIIRNLRKQNHIFTLAVAHPPSPSSRTGFAQRNQQLEEFGQYLEQISDDLIVLGDFNTSPWSPYYRRFATRAHLRDSRQGFGLYPTWAAPRIRRMPRWMQPLLSVPIDHIFTRAGTLKLGSTSFHTGPYIGSDHLPVIADIGIIKS